MISSSSIQSEVKKIMDNGTLCRFRYFSIIDQDADDYDDSISISQSGVDFWTSGLLMPLKSKDAILIQQGLLRNDDKVLYVLGTVKTNGDFKIGIGSPVEGDYTVTELGVKTWQIGNDDVYKKIYVRRLSTGSVFGE